MEITKKFLADLLTSSNIWGWEVQENQIGDEAFEKFELGYSDIIKKYPDYEPDDMDYQGEPDNLLISVLETSAQSMGKSLFNRPDNDVDESLSKAIDRDGLFIDIGSEIEDDNGNKGYVVDIIDRNKISVEFDEGDLDDGTYNSKLFTICESKGDKSVNLPNCNLLLYGFGHDINGNKIIKIGYPNQRAFSIQTSDGLKFPNSKSFDKTTKLSDLNDSDLEKICGEVSQYIEKFGSKEQKSKLKIYNKKIKESSDDDEDIDIREENINKIKSLLGKKNSYSGSADWGGIDVWTLKGDNFKGTFLVIDDNDDVVILERTFNEDTEENEDEEILSVPIDDNIDSLLDKAISIKSGKITESKGDFDIEDIASILYDIRSFGLVDHEDNYQKLLDYLENNETKLSISQNAIDFGEFIFSLYKKFNLGDSRELFDEVQEAIHDRIKEMIDFDYLGESKKESYIAEYKRKAKERFSKIIGKSENGKTEYSTSNKSSKQTPKNFSTKGGSLIDDYKKDARKNFEKAFSKIKESKSNDLDISVSIMEDILLSKYLTKLGINFERSKADNVPNGIRYKISCSAKEKTSLEDYLDKVGYRIKINESKSIKEDNSKAYHKSGHKDFVKLLSKYKLKPESGRVTGEESQEYFFPDNAEKELEKFGYTRLKKDKVTDKGDKNFGKSGYFITYNWINESDDDILTINHDQTCSFVGQIGGSCFLTAGTKVKVLSEDSISKTVKILDGSFKGDIVTISSKTNESKSFIFRKPIIPGINHFINEAKIKKDYMLELSKSDGFEREYFEDINDMTDRLESLSEEEAKNYKTFKRDKKSGKYEPIAESKDDFDSQISKIKKWFDSKYDSSYDFAFDGEIVQIYNEKKLIESLNIATI
jgi:hypothetical protein